MTAPGSTVLTMPARFASVGDPHAAMDAAVGSLESLLALAARDEAAGLGDAPWPPHFKKMAGEGTRVAPSRAKARAKSEGQADESAAPSAAGRRRSKMPLLVIANSPDKEAALAGLERWKSKYPDAAQHLTVADVLVDAQRGRSSTWTRVRVNLQHVPEALRPPQETPDPDDDPTREWRAAMAAGKPPRKRAPKKPPES